VSVRCIIWEGRDSIEPCKCLFGISANAFTRLSQTSESLKRCYVSIVSCQVRIPNLLCSGTKMRMDPLLTHFLTPSRVLFFRPAMRAVSSRMQLNSLREAMRFSGVSGAEPRKEDFCCCIVMSTTHSFCSGDAMFSTR
jgi:hypothetical protein